MSKDVVRPPPPEYSAEYKEYFDTPFALYLGQVKLNAVNDLMKTPPRPNNATTAGDDGAAYALKAHKTGGAGTAAVKAARQELYEKGQRAGTKLKEIAKQFNADFLWVLNDTVCVGGGGRFTAYVQRILHSYPVSGAAKQEHHRSKLLYTLGEEDSLIRINYALDSKQQMTRYRNDVNLVRAEHASAVAADAALAGFAVSDNELVQQLIKMAPPRFPRAWKNDELKPMLTDNDGFNKALGKMIKEDGESALVHGTPEFGASVFTIGADKPAQPAPGASGCRFFADPQKGCNRAHSCRWDHVGFGFVRNASGFVKKVEMNKPGNAKRREPPRGKTGNKRKQQFDDSKQYKIRRRGDKILFTEIAGAAEGDAAGATAGAAEAGSKKKKSATLKSAVWKILTIGMFLSCSVVDLVAGQQPFEPGAGVHLADTPVLHTDLFFGEMKALSVKPHSKTGRISSDQFVAVDDSGAATRGGVCTTADKFFHLDRDVYHPPVYDARGKRAAVQGVGTLKLNVRTNRGDRAVTIRNVLYVPSFSTDVISHNQLLDEDFQFNSTKRHGAVWSAPCGVEIPLARRPGLNWWGTTVIRGDDTEVSTLNDVPAKSINAIAASANDTAALVSLLSDPTIANCTQRRNVIRKRLANLGCYATNNPNTDRFLAEHCRLGHASTQRTVGALLEAGRDMADIKKGFGSIAMAFCEHCAAAKITRADIPNPRPGTKPRPRATVPGQRTFVDVAGRFDRTAIGTKFRYELGFVDDCTGYATVYGMSSLDEVPALVGRYYDWLSAQGHKVPDGSIVLEEDGAFDLGKGRRMHGGSASYFRSPAARKAYRNHNVSFECSAPGQQYYNGKVERFWRSIHSRSRAMRSAAELGYEHWYWPDPHATATHNMLPTKGNDKGCSPNRAFHGRVIDNIHTFGRKCWALTTVAKPKSRVPGEPAIYLGYNDETRAHRLMLVPTADRDRHQYVESNHISLDGNNALPAVRAGRSPLVAYDYVPYDGGYDYVEVDSDTIAVQPPNTQPFELGEDTVVISTITDTDGHDIHVVPDDESMIYHIVDDRSYVYCTDADDDTVVTTPSGGTIPGVPVNVTTQFTRRKAFEQHPDKFRLADRKEIDQLLRRGTITQTRITDAPYGAPIYNSLMVRVLKDDGKTTKAKPRLVLDESRSSTDEYSVSQTRTITPRFATIRMLIALAAARLGCKVWQYDIPNAFCQAPSDATRYMRMPRGDREYDNDGVEFVYAVQNLYGGRCTGRNYQNHCVAWLKSIGFTQCPSGPATWYRPAGSTATPDEIQRHRDAPEPKNADCKTKRSKRVSFDGAPKINAIRMAVYVDDCIIVADDDAAAWLGAKLTAMWDPEGDKPPPTPAKHALGMDINQSRPGIITVSNAGLIDKLVAQFSVKTSRKTPLSPGTNICVADADDESVTFLNKAQHKQYRSGTALITYLSTTTRPDLTHAASQLGRVQHRPTTDDYANLEHAVAYCLGTRTKGLRYGTPSADGALNTLAALADASWADDKSNRRSTHGYVCFLNGGPVSWHSRQGKPVALSTAEAELAAASGAGKDLVHLRDLLLQLKMPQHDPAVVGEDNQATIRIPPDVNSSCTTRTRHIAARYYWLREQVELGSLIFDYCPTEQMIADINTKSLPIAQYTLLRDMIVHDTKHDDPNQPGDEDVAEYVRQVRP